MVHQSQIVLIGLCNKLFRHAVSQAHIKCVHLNLSVGLPYKDQEELDPKSAQGEALRVVEYGEGHRGRHLRKGLFPLPRKLY